VSREAGSPGGLRGGLRRARRALRGAATPVVRAVIALVTGTGLPLFACTGCFSTSQPTVRLTPDEVRGLQSFPVEIWDDLLRAVVDDEGRVDYAAVRQRRHALDAFLAAVADAGPRARPDLFPDDAAKLAFAINAYNALVFRNVVDRPPLRRIDESLANFFYFTRFVIDGEEYSLKTYEDDVVRAVFRDPRVHFALNCASRGCPRLPAEAFRGAILEAQLDREARKFCNESRNVRVQGGKVYLSKIFEWYEDDFTSFEERNGNPNGSVIDYINRWRDATARIDESLPIEHVPYDWTINARAAPGATPSSK
jgi:hypothetical protein